MLRTAKHVMGYKIEGTNGGIGACKDILFRDDDWTISYITVDTGSWLPGKKVLVARSVISRPDWESKRIPVSLSVEQIKDCPTLDADEVVSADYERRCREQMNWPAMAAASTSMAGPVLPPSVPSSLARSVEAEGENALRSMNEVNGYQLDALEGKIGTVCDFIFDDESWRVRYLVADTGSWLSGRQVLVSTQWIDSVEWADSRVVVNLSVDAIKNSPEFDPSVAVNREYEARLYDYYGKPVDW